MLPAAFAAIAPRPFRQGLISSRLLWITPVCVLFFFSGEGGGGGGGGGGWGGAPPPPQYGGGVWLG